MAMPVLRVKAVANIMGLRRGDEGEVVTGEPFVDAMVNAGYLQVLETYPDPEPRRPKRRRRPQLKRGIAEAAARLPDPEPKPCFEVPCPPMVEIEATTAHLDPGPVSIDYAAMTVAQLRAEARERDLSVSGVKAELVARLEAADAGAAHPSDGLPKPG